MQSRAAYAERRLRAKPTLGLIYVEHKSGVVRRVLLTKTSHHLYYRYNPDREELIVLAVWGAPKERGPKLVHSLVGLSFHITPMLA